MIKIESLCYSYGNNPILKEVTFTVNSKEIVALIGCSGSGKTTLFRLISGLLKPKAGRISIQGNNPLTYMQQKDLLLPWRTVLKNLLLLSELGKNKEKQDRLLTQAYTVLKQVGLEAAMDKYPHELSGGMRQRVSLARALLQNRPVILLDEPFSSLDVILREQLYKLLQQIRESDKKTILMVTHDFRDALYLADRILVLCDGKIQADFKILEKMRNSPHSEELIQKMRDLLTA